MDSALQIYLDLAVIMIRPGGMGKLYDLISFEPLNKDMNSDDLEIRIKTKRLIPDKTFSC